MPKNAIVLRGNFNDDVTVPGHYDPDVSTTFGATDLVFYVPGPGADRVVYDATYTSAS